MTFRSFTDGCRHSESSSYFLYGNKNTDTVVMPYSARAAQQRRIAAEALPCFGFADASYQLIKLGTTTTFRVVSARSQSYVLRLQPLSRMPLNVVRSEVRWLTDLQDTALLIPTPIP